MLGEYYLARQIRALTDGTAKDVPTTHLKSALYPHNLDQWYFLLLQENLLDHRYLAMIGPSAEKSHGWPFWLCFQTPTQIACSWIICRNYVNFITLFPAAQTTWFLVSWLHLSLCVRFLKATGDVDYIHICLSQFKAMFSNCCNQVSIDFFDIVMHIISSSNRSNPTALDW